MQQPQPQQPQQPQPQQPRIKVVLGTMEFGRPERETESEAVSHQAVEMFVKAGHKELDTAYMYVSGKTEEILGKMTPQLKSKVLISTKANPWEQAWQGLSAEGINGQFSGSSKRLNVDQIDIYYLHAPDHKTPIEVSLKTVNELYQQGKFKRFGLSNYAAWQVVEIYYICKQNGWVLPTVYQGMYNGLTREVERELFPALRRLNIAFYAYNPLAGGLLTGRYKYEDKEQQPTGRFFGNHWAQIYQQRYWHPCFFQALSLIQAAIEKVNKEKGENSTVTDAAFRWMFHHSKMAGQFGDGLIIGASSMKYMEQNLKYCDMGPLDPAVVKAFDEGWELTKSQCPAYFR